MYLQITTRCNMSCEHCGFSCTNKGDDMSLETARKALKTFEGDLVTIGGGEPTIHPMFWQILGMTFEHQYMLGDECLMPYIITNGSMTDISLALAMMSEKGVIGCVLSRDIYHDEIDESVVRAFGSNIRDAQGHEINNGRCNFGNDDNCLCDDFIVTPSGDIKMCGCDNSPVIGNVFDQKFNKDEWLNDDRDHLCYKQYQEEKILT